MKEYLKELGLTESLLESMDDLAQDKELRLYINWLESVNNFIKK